MRFMEVILVPYSSVKFRWPRLVPSGIASSDFSTRSAYFSAAVIDGSPLLRTAVSSSASPPVSS